MMNVNSDIVSKMLEPLSKYATLDQDGYAIAIYTTEGKVYTYKDKIEDEHERAFSEIISNMKDPIHYIICVRGEKMTIDIPPYYLRKKLCEINEKNYKAEIVMQGMNSLCLKKMQDTLL